MISERRKYRITIKCEKYVVFTHAAEFFSTNEGFIAWETTSIDTRAAINNFVLKFGNLPANFEITEVKSDD